MCCRILARKPATIATITTGQRRFDNAFHGKNGTTLKAHKEIRATTELHIRYVSDALKLTEPAPASMKLKSSNNWSAMEIAFELGDKNCFVVSVWVGASVRCVYVDFLISSHSPAVYICCLGQTRFPTPRECGTHFAVVLLLCGIWSKCTNEAIRPVLPRV